MSVFEGSVSVAEILAYLESDRYMARVETAHYMGISTRTLDTIEGLPAYRIGAKRLRKKSEVDAWMQAHRETPNDLEVIVEECFEAVNKRKDGELK
jgi:hypothetical protein